MENLGLLGRKTGNFFFRGLSTPCSQSARQCFVWLHKVQQG